MDRAVKLSRKGWRQELKEALADTTVTELDATGTPKMKAFGCFTARPSKRVFCLLIRTRREKARCLNVASLVRKMQGCCMGSCEMGSLRSV